MRRSLERAVACACAAAVVAGCAGSQRRARRPPGTIRARGVAVEFPSRAELARIATAAPAPVAHREAAAPLERWELAGPFPSTVGMRPSDDASPLAALLRSRAERSGGRAVLTEAMQCVARELGRYMLRHEGLPPQPLTDFVMGRCGAMTSNAGLQTSGVTVPARLSDREVLEHFRADLGQQADALLGLAEGPINVGAWAGREGDRFKAVLVVERRQVELEPTSTAPDARGAVTLQGRVLEPAEQLVGYVNQGAWESARCEPDGTARLPAFRLRCPVRAGDAVARVELSTVPPGRLLSHVVFSTVVGAGRDAARTFDVMPEDPAHAAGDARRSRDVLVGLVNEARAAAGAPPVTAAEREAEALCEVTPAYFASAGGAQGGGERVDRIALGLMAGWDVQGGMIRDGRVFTSGGASDNDLARWLAWTLERPMGRQVLLDRAVRQVAVCPWTVEGRTEGLLWSSYTFYDDRETPEEVERVYRGLDTARQRGGRASVRRLTHLHGMMKGVAQSLERNAADPESALQAMLERAAATAPGSVRGWVIPTTDLDSIEFPQDLVGSGSLAAAVQIAHWRAPRAAWGQMVVFVLVGG